MLQPAVDDGQGSTTWRITLEQKQQALDLFEAGKSITAIAQATGMAWSTARLLLADAIEGLDRQSAPQHVMAKSEIAEAQTLHAQGWSHTRLAKLYGVSRTTVAKRLKAQAARS